MRALPVQMVTVGSRSLQEEVRGFGSLSFLKKLDVLSPADGILDTLHFREGDRIERGDIIGIIRNPFINLSARRAEDSYTQAQAALDLALARLRDSEFMVEARLLENEKTREELVQARKILEEEQRKSENREALYEAGALSDEAIREERFRLDTAETQLMLMERDLEIRRVGLRREDLASLGYEVPADEGELRRALIVMATSALRAEAAAARANLEAASREVESALIMERDLVMRSPFSGIVGLRYTEEGEQLRRDDKILTIMDTDFLYAVFPVPESDAPKLERGMAALVETGGEETHKGEVDLVSPHADNQSFNFMVRVILSPHENDFLRPGMFARVSVPLEHPRPITVIPEAALVHKRENTGRVFTIHNNLLSERDVVLGAIWGDEREIVSGLSLGEVIAMGPKEAFKEGLYVSEAP